MIFEPKPNTLFTPPAAEPEDENAQTIFDLQIETTPTYDTRSKRDASIANLASQLRSNNHQANPNGEPDWNDLLLNAPNMAEKFRIRAAKAAWAEELRFITHQKVQEHEQAHRANVLNATPVGERTEQWWRQLSQTEPRVYWSVEAQRQRRADKQQLGLNFYSKKRVPK